MVDLWCVGAVAIVKVGGIVSTEVWHVMVELTMVVKAGLMVRVAVEVAMEVVVAREVVVDGEIVVTDVGIGGTVVVVVTVEVFDTVVGMSGVDIVMRVAIIRDQGAACIVTSELNL